MPPAPKRRQQQRAETRRRIYDAAMRLFEERGFEAVSVQQIAAAAGVTTPTFYANFPGKEDIVFLVPTVEELAPFLALDAGELSLAERIRLGMPHWMASFGPEERQAVYERWRVVATTPSLRLRAAEFERRSAHAVLDALAGAGFVLSPSDRVIVSAFLAAFTASALDWADSGGRRSLEECAAEALAGLENL